LKTSQKPTTVKPSQQCSPKPGNKTFINQYDSLISPNINYRIANNKNIVTKVLIGDFVHTGNNDYTFSYTQKGWTENDIHSLTDDYAHPQ
jgi:hypothetical protein